MGLDAAVVLNADADLSDATQVFAKAHLGNVAMIAHLRSAALASLGAESILVSKVLYSGMHCGDMIEPRDMPALREELLAFNSVDPDVAHFKETMGNLVGVAIERGGGILF